ncbi:MAG: CDP-alcohol phosphatidyltransferase family protein [Candidatus Melainabacteria bacterium]|nr:MAG: CDP-alcohol phosphatidyltransferase family protein [Candidatus Melainabacteria bacterium]
MNQIPNIITFVRLFAATAIALDCTNPSCWKSFIYWFVAAGISDMLDGAIARRFNWCSQFGARLDSISDLALYMAVTLAICVSRGYAISENCLLVLVGFALQIHHIWYCWSKFRTFPAYHSDLARLSAYGIFFLVVFFWCFGNTLFITVSLALWVLCSVEGVLITQRLQESRENVPGLWAIQSANSESKIGNSELKVVNLE